MRIFASIIVLLSFTAASAAQSARPAKRMGLMQATGFPNYCGGSLECIVSESQEIFRGTILSISGEELTVQVRETISGPTRPGDTLTIDAGGWSFGAGQDVLFSLVNDKNGRRSRRGSFINRPIILDGQRPYYTMDLRPHTDTKDVLGTVRDLVEHPIDPKLQRVSLYSGGRILVVPAEAKLEGLAQQWATDKTLYKRLLALQALQPFKSERSIATATALLDDIRSLDGRGGKWQEGNYTVREAAAKLLANWQVPAPALPMSGPVFTYRQIDPPRIGYFIAIAIAIVLFVLIAWSYHRRSAMVLRIASSIFMLAVISALLALWWRSGTRVDEIMFAAGTSHHQIASYSGGLQYQVMHEWESPRQLVYGSFDREISDDVWSIDLQTPAKRRSTMGFCFASGTGAGPEGSTHRFGLFRIPFWAPLALALIPLALNGVALAQQYRRRRLGLCRHCGYDLRETPSGLCPECGNGIPSKHRPASAPLQAGDEMPVGGHAVGM